MDGEQPFDPLDAIVLIHPAANCFRLMHQDELASLAADIAAHGLRDAITLGRIDGEDVGIVDGRNRHLACQMAEVTPHYVTIDFKDDDEVRAFVVSRSERRDITKGERAMSLALAYREPEKGGRGKKAVANTAAKRGGFSMDRVDAARQVLRYNEELALHVRDGITKLDDALGKVRAAQTALVSEEAQMNRLREEAPDLADLVTEDRLTLVGAIADADERARKKRVTIEQGHLAAAEIVTDFATHVAAMVAANELGEPVSLDKDQREQLRAAFALLKQRRIG